MYVLISEVSKNPLSISILDGISSSIQVVDSTNSNALSA